MNIKKGDTVQIMAGKDKGKTGKVLNVNLKSQRILVEGVNVYKKHTKAKSEAEKGQIVSLPRSLNYSNVLIHCSNCSKGVRFGVKLEKGDKKSRYCKNCEISL